MCLPPSALRWSIGPLPQIEAGAHLSVIASTVVPAASDLELVAEGCERIALEVIDLPCTLQRAVPLQLPKLDLVELGRALQTAAVEGGRCGATNVSNSSRYSRAISSHTSGKEGAVAVSSGRMPVHLVFQ